MTDKHFNIFYSYSRGNDKTGMNISVIENNLTRAVMICLKESSDFMRKFIGSIIDESNESTKHLYAKNIICDLQELKNENKMIARKTRKWYLVSLSPEKYNASRKNNDVEKACKIFGGTDEGAKRKELRKIEELIKKTKNTDEDKRNEYSACIDYYHSNGRPDAWIINKNSSWGICIETKKYGFPSVSQMRRHEKKIKKLSNVRNIPVKIKSVTWDDIYKILNGNNVFIKKLKELIKMDHLRSTLDMSFLLQKDDGFEEESRYQFGLLLEKMDEVFKKNGFERRSKEQKKSELWAAYVKSPEKLHYPHYSIYMFPSFIGIGVTLKGGRKQEEEFLENINKIRIPPKESLFYYVRLVDYRTITGTQKGLTHEGFNYHFTLEKKEKQRKLQFLTLLHIAETNEIQHKQLEFGFSIPLKYALHQGKENDVSKFAKKIIGDPSKLWSKYEKFIKDTCKVFFK